MNDDDFIAGPLATRPKENEPSDEPLLAGPKATELGWERPNYDAADGLLPSPAKWNPRWHRSLTEEDEREIASLKKQLTWAMDDIRRVARGHRRSMAFGGPSGIGKSTICRAVLNQEGFREGFTEGERYYVSHTGRITGRDLFILFLEHPDALFVFDDSEDALTDKQVTVLLRAACEMTNVRLLHWRTGAAPKVRPGDTGLSDRELDEYRDEDGNLPAIIQVRRFEFRGRVIIITNDDLLRAAKHDRRQTRKQGIAALVDRLQPIDIGHRDRHIALLRLEQLCAEEALGWRKGLSFAEEGELLHEFRSSSKLFHNVTIRTFLDACDLRREYPDDWRDRLARYFDADMRKRTRRGGL
jgi:hypothetical protein